MNKKDFKRGDRVQVRQDAGFHRGATGVVEYVEPTGKCWVLRDGASCALHYAPEELEHEGDGPMTRFAWRPVTPALLRRADPALRGLALWVCVDGGVSIGSYHRMRGGLQEHWFVVGHGRAVSADAVSHIMLCEVPRPPIIAQELKPPVTAQELTP